MPSFAFGASCAGTASAFGASATGSAFGAEAAVLPNFLRIISCPASSTLLCAAFTAYYVFVNVSIISFELIPNSFASS